MLVTLVLLTLFGSGGVSSPNSFHKDEASCQRVGETIRAKGRDFPGGPPAFTCTEALAVVPVETPSIPQVVGPTGQGGIQPPQGIRTASGLLSPEQLRQKCAILTKEQRREIQVYGACMGLD